jgi:hypothetical protein
MNISPTLTPSEFADVHNAKCELHGILQSMEGVVHPKMAARLQKAIDLLNKGLKNAYEQDDAMAEKSIDSAGKVAIEHNLKAIWSLHEVEDLLADHPFGKITKLQYHTSSVHVTADVEGPTWKDLYIAADGAIDASGDTHHIFVEDFQPKPGRADTLMLSTGS